MSPEQELQQKIELATRAEQSNNPTSAIRLWLDVLELDPIHEAAYQSLARLYKREQRWGELASVYERQADLALLPEDLILLYQKLAFLYEEELKDNPRALECWARILDLDPEHTIAKARTQT